MLSLISLHMFLSLIVSHNSGPKLYDWPLLGNVSSRPSLLTKQPTFERQSSASSRRKKTLDFQPSDNVPAVNKAPATTTSFATAGGKVPKRRGSLVILETEDFSEEQSEELEEWSALPGAPQASPVHFDLFDDILDVFSEQVDTKDDPTFLGNAWGVSLFEQAVSDADIAADVAYEKLMEENRERERREYEKQREEEEKKEAKEEINEEVEEDVKEEVAPVKRVAVKKVASQSPHVSMLDSMSWILQDDAVMSDFQQKLEQEYAAESLYFYKAARKFHTLAIKEKAQIDKLEGGWADSESLVEAKSIYHNFIKNNSDQQINVNHT